MTRDLGTIHGAERVALLESIGHDDLAQDVQRALRRRAPRRTCARCGGWAKRGHGPVTCGRCLATLANAEARRGA